MYDKVTVRNEWICDAQTDRRCDDIMPSFGGIQIQRFKSYGEDTKCWLLYIWPLSVTLTLGVATQLLPFAHVLIIVINCDKLFFFKNQQLKSYGADTKCRLFNIWPQSMTLTFWVATQLLRSACFLIMVITCAELFQKKISSLKVMEKPGNVDFLLWNENFLTFDVWVWSWPWNPIIAVCTLSHSGYRLCRQVISKNFSAV
jgi:hypothetical protein